jgi:DNA-binding GntR family transcriptional regulator
MSPPALPADPIPRPEPLRVAVYARLVALIVSAEYRPGSVLTEAALSRAMGVSRTPVREALLRLEAEGVLESTLARGFMLRPLSRSEAAELYPILAALEALAVQDAGPAVEPVLGTLHGTLDELEGCADAVRRWQLDTAWHATLTSACGNRHLAGLIAQLRTSLSRYELAYMQQVRSREKADQQHREILGALEAGDAHRAADLLTEHWHDGGQIILRWLAGSDPAFAGPPGKPPKPPPADPETASHPGPRT